MIQTRNGKAFEYALLCALEYMVTNNNPNRKINIIKNSSYNVAYKYFESLGGVEKKPYISASDLAIASILNLEPRLIHPCIKDDCLDIKLQKDNKGQEGDVRDILSISSEQGWEIGFSAKNNHRALKHSRLSNTIDFGEKWLNIPNSIDYFNRIRPIFDNLSCLKKTNTEWKDIKHKENSVYLPIMLAFKEELSNLYLKYKEKVASNMFQYLLGKQDFYKVIKSKNEVEIQAFNLYGTLNKPSNNIKPIIEVPRLQIPYIITDIDFKENKTNTLIVTFEPEWKIAFRIHNASTKVEPSLKFDITLVSIPQSLYTVIHKCYY